MLQQSNYAEWLAALQGAIIIEDADWLLNADKNLPAGKTDPENFKLKAAVKALIFKSMSEQIRSELPVQTLVEDAAFMLDAIQKMYFANNEAAHRRLENDAKMLRLKPDRNINEYMFAHTVMWRKMYQVGYSNIDTEVTKSDLWWKA